MKYSNLLLALIFSLLLSVSAFAYTSEVSESQPFTLYFDEEAPLIVENSRAEVDFLFNIPEKHHLYRDMLTIEFESDQFDAVFVKPAGILKYDAFMDEETQVYHDQLVTTLKLNFPKDYDYSQPVRGQIIFQGCSDKICFRSVKNQFEFALEAPQTSIQKVSEEPVVKTEISLAELIRSHDIKNLLNLGLMWALLVTFLAGVVTGFTPCVLPVIPLTLAFIGVTPKSSKTKRVWQLMIFVFGMVMMYATLGVVSAYLGRTLGFFYQSQVFLIILVIFFTLMALWLLGLIQINIPAKFQSRLSAYQPQGFFRNFYAGLTIGFLAAPCVGPIIGPVLIYISATQDISLGFVLMATYALGLSVLFIVLAFFSRAWIGMFGTKSQLIKKILAGLLLLTAIYYLFILVSPYISKQGQSHGLFYTQMTEATAVAKKENKKLMIDFYADWCLPCKEWDRFVWSDPKVKETLSEVGYIAVKIDCTVETDQCEAAVDRFKVIGWPTIIFVDERDQELESLRIMGQVMDASQFIEHLKQEIKPE